MLEDRTDLCPMEQLAEYRATELYSIYEYCQTLEQQVYEIMDRSSDHDRCVLQSYIDIRNDLEIETIKAFLQKKIRITP